MISVCGTIVAREYFVLINFQLIFFFVFYSPTVLLKTITKDKRKYFRTEFRYARHSSYHFFFVFKTLMILPIAREKEIVVISSRYKTKIPNSRFAPNSHLTCDFYDSL